jgi:hypothetical protein
MTALSAVLVVGEEGPEALRASLGTFRARYADAPLAVISDGVDDRDYARVCERYGAQYILDHYYGRIECGGRWWRRTLATGLSYGTKWIVSVDLSAPCWPDLTTEPLNPLTGLLCAADPEEDRQSGCQAIRRDVATRLLESGSLDCPELTRYSLLCRAGYAPRTWLPVGCLPPALVLRYVSAQLGIQAAEWPHDGRCATAPPMPPSPPRHGVARDTPLIIITTCKGRRHHLEQTLPGWLAEPHVSVIVVDYDCPDEIGAWLATHYPAVHVVSVRHRPTFNLGRARNIGAAAAPAGWWAFLDADMAVAAGWGGAVRSVLSRGRYHLAEPLTSKTYGSCILHSADYATAGGYDDLIEGWGSEDFDFYGRCRQCNIRPASWGATLAQPIQHSDHERTRFHQHNKFIAADLNGQYVWAKHTIMTDAWRLPTSEECEVLRAALTSQLADAAGL